MSNSRTAILSMVGEHNEEDKGPRLVGNKSVPHDVNESPLTPTPARHTMRQRLMSDESHESDSSKATSLGYCDSGNYSSTNVSDSQPVKKSNRNQDVLRQKDQALFLALQDVRRLRSELERLSKSEKWYKQELRQQKHARLEALEKLYGNERNYMQENQRLQRECLRLYAKCGDIERELEHQRVKQTLEARQRQEQETQLRQGRADSEQRDFEYDQQQALIVDQQQLIEVLRKQKRALLADFKRLNEEKDAQIYDLQRNIALLEAENIQVTKKCKNLLDERRYLEETIAEHGNELLEQQEKQRKLELAAQATELTLEEQQRDLAEKEKEIQELQRNFKQALQNEDEPDAIHRLSVDFQKELWEKTQEIMALKNAQQTLQQELEVLNELQTQNEQQQRELERWEATLADKNCELRQLQECDARKCAEIAALKAEVAEYQNMTRNLEQREQERQESYIAEMLRSQEKIKSVEMELINANQRYATMCVLCERTRFELDMREIELSKFKFEKCRDVADVEHLREKLADYLKQTKELSLRIQELEEELNEQKKLAKTVLKVEKGTQWTILEHIKDELMEEINGVMMEENLSKIKQENFLYENECEEIFERDSVDGEINVAKEDIVKQKKLKDEAYLRVFGMTCESFESDKECEEKNVETFQDNFERNGIFEVFEFNEENGDWAQLRKSEEEEVCIEWLEAATNKDDFERGGSLQVDKVNYENRDKNEVGEGAENKDFIIQKENFDEENCSSERSERRFTGENFEEQNCSEQLERQFKRKDFDEQNCREQTECRLGKENGEVCESSDELNDELEDIDLCELDIQFGDIMAYLKKLENENKSVKKFIQARHLKNAQGNEIKTTKMHTKENKKHHLTTDKEPNKTVQLDLKSPEKPNNHIKPQSRDMETLQFKLDVIYEYLRRIQKETREQKEMIRNFKNEFKKDQNLTESEFEKPFRKENKEIYMIEKPFTTLLETEYQELCRLSSKVSLTNDIEIKNSSERLLETHQLIEKLQEKNDEFKKLIEAHRIISEQQQKNEEAMKELKTELNLLKSENEQKNAQIHKLQTQLSESQASVENLVKAKQEAQLKLQESQNLNQQNITAFQHAREELQKSTAAIKMLHLKLLYNDALLYKMQKRKEQLKSELEETSEKLLAVNEKYEQESHQEHKPQQNTEQKPEAHRETNIDQNGVQELQTPMDIVSDKSEFSSVFNSRENETAEELHYLRARVAELETALKQAYNDDSQQRSERIELLNKLIEQQNEKVTQLNAAQADWEELLNQLNAAHAQEAATSAELQQKRAALEELNELFHKQNFELQRLYKINQNQDSSKDRELEALKKTCAQQEAALKTQADLIESLHLKNQHLEKTVNEDYAAEVGENKKELRMLRQQVSKLSEERQDVASRMEEMEKELGELRHAKRQAIVVPQVVYADRESTIIRDNHASSAEAKIQEMEKELNELRLAKRQAIVVPQLVYGDSDSIATTDSHASNAASSEECISANRVDIDDHLRILAKVLEHEYKRKTERSELHISALLSNIKRLKRSLSGKEQELAKLQAQQALNNEQEEELQSTKRQLLEMRHRCEQSQRVAKTLEQELFELRKHYENTDCGKSSVNEPAHEVANLIDDHKKLIQLSAVNSKRPKTSTILELIQRSNRCVPNLNKLGSSIEELRHDIQQYIGASQMALSQGNFATHAYRQPSLMDELHQAAIANA